METVKFNFTWERKADGTYRGAIEVTGRFHGVGSKPLSTESAAMIDAGARRQEVQDWLDSGGQLLVVMKAPDGRKKTLAGIKWPAPEETGDTERWEKTEPCRPRFVVNGAGAEASGGTD